MTTTSLPPSGAEKARLVRRAQAVARIRHPNLARLLPLPGGAGLQPILGDAHKLSDFTLPAGTFKRFDLEQVVRLLLDVLAGLSALHEVVTDGEAFVHGEVCPSNVYVDEHGTARLVPLLNVHSAPTPPRPSGYAAPERLLGSVPDARVDTFSVGVMLWEALAGKRLFPDPSPAAVLARQIPPIQLGARLAWAQPLCAIAERAIAYEPYARFQTAHELANAIAAAAAQQLSRVDHEAWQEEAPTPVFQPRVHLAGLRASTSPPVVVEAAPPSIETAPDTVSPLVSDDAPNSERPVGARWRARTALGLTALTLIGALAWQGWRSRFGAERAAEPAVAAAPPVPAPNVVSIPTASSQPAPSAAAAASAAPSSKPATARPSRQLRAPRPKAAAPTADYGI